MCRNGWHKEDTTGKRDLMGGSLVKGAEDIVADRVTEDVISVHQCVLQIEFGT